MLNLNWTNAELAANSVLGITFYVLMIATTLVIALFVFRNRKNIATPDDSFEKIYGTLFYEFKDDARVTGACFYVWFFFRRTAYVFILIQLRHFPIA